MRIFKIQMPVWSLLVLLSVALRIAQVLIGYSFVHPDADWDLSLIWQAYREVFIKAGDSPHYQFLAEHGYQASGDRAKLIVFYPLYPLLIALAETVLGDFFVAGLLVSHICLIVASLVMYRLLAQQFDARTGLHGVLLMQLFPVSFFLGGVFTESLFLMLSVLVLYYCGQRNFLLASLFALLAGLTRTQGLLLLLPVAYDYALARQLFTNGGFRRLDRQLFWVVLIPLGFASYLLLNQWVQGDWFAFRAHLSAPPWWQGLDWVGNNIAQNYGMSQAHFHLGFYIYWPQILGFFLSLALLCWAIQRQLPTSWIVLAASCLMLSYSASWLISGARYLLGNMGLLLLLSVFVRDAFHRWLVYTAFAFLMVFFTVAFWQGQAVM